MNEVKKQVRSFIAFVILKQYIQVKKKSNRIVVDYLL